MAPKRPTPSGRALYPSSGGLLFLLQNLRSSWLWGRYRSGQTGQTVNLLAHAFEGSNPSLPTICALPCGVFKNTRGCSSMVERQPSKLTTRVRFPSPAPLLSDESAFRILVKQGAALAQLVERVLGKDEVLGSNPKGSSILKQRRSSRCPYVPSAATAVVSPRSPSWPRKSSSATSHT